MLVASNVQLFWSEFFHLIIFVLIFADFQQFGGLVWSTPTFSKPNCLRLLEVWRHTGVRAGFSRARAAQGYALWTHFCFAHTTKQARKTSHYWVLIAWYRSGVVECVTFVSSVRLLSGVCVFGCVTTVCVCLCVCACGACGACVRYFSLW